MDNDTIKTNICNYLKEGMSKKDASVMSGISESSFYRWIEEDESFKSHVEASLLEYKRTLIKNMTTCAEKDGRLALEILKRRYPKEWDYQITAVERVRDLNQERKDVVTLLEKILKDEDKTTDTEVPVIPNGQT